MSADVIWMKLWDHMQGDHGYVGWQYGMSAENKMQTGNLTIDNKDVPTLLNILILVFKAVTVDRYSGYQYGHLLI